MNDREFHLCLLVAQRRLSPCIGAADHAACPGHVPEPASGPTFPCTAFPTTQSPRALGDSAFHLKDVVPISPRASLTRGSPPKTPDTGQQPAQETHNKDTTSSSPEKATRSILQSVPLLQPSVITKHVEVCSRTTEGPSEA